MPSVRSVPHPGSELRAEPASAVAAVEAEVRELVRRRGIDPVAEPAAVERLVEQVVADYLDRSLTARLPPLTDPPAAARTVLDAVAGFGPLQPLFDDPHIEEIWINDPGRVFVARRGRSELTNLILSAEQVAELVERMLRSTGRRLDLSTPFVDAMLADGSRLHVVIPTITRRHMAVNIRKFVLGLTSLDELVGAGSLTEPAARFLEAAVTAGLNVLVSGGTQAGKTTMLNALCAAIPARERVVTVEEVFELQVPLPDCVAMQTRQPNLEGTGEIPLRRLVKEALRMRPSRLIVGEVRQEECLDLLIALNSGLPGMCTLHANSAREALMKVCTLPLLAGENVSSAFVVPTVATCVDLVVHLAVDARGHRRVREIVGVTGRVEAEVIETTELFTVRAGRLERADGYPPRPERFEAAGIDLAGVLGRRADRGRHAEAAPSAWSVPPSEAAPSAVPFTGVVSFTDPAPAAGPAPAADPAESALAADAPPARGGSRGGSDGGSSGGSGGGSNGERRLAAVRRPARRS